MSNSGSWLQQQQSEVGAVKDTGSPPPVSSAMSDASGGSANDDLSNEADGIWSPDIEQSFKEALAIYPPCGRRKIILSDEGKMYGRNELIARYIKLRTGKSRSRKQVSSHIQVLARRTSKEIQSNIKDHVTKEKIMQNLASMSSAQIVSASAMHGKERVQPIHHQPSAATAASSVPYAPVWNAGMSSPDVKLPLIYNPVDKAADMTLTSWPAFPIAGPRLRLTQFSAFVERAHEHDASYMKHLFVHLGTNNVYAEPLEAIDIRQIADKFPDKKGGLKDLFDRGPQAAFYLIKFWADLNTDITDDVSASYAASSQYESSEQMTLQVSTKVCSFGKQVVEKVEKQDATYENGRCVYRISRSSMCEYLTSFINKLKRLPEKYMMNSVLENFTILQIVSNQQETLLCLAFVFEVSTSEHGAQHHIYRLVRD